MNADHGTYRGYSWIRVSQRFRIVDPRGCFVCYVADDIEEMQRAVDIECKSPRTLARTTGQMALELT